MTNSDNQLASVWKRCWAFLIDVIPITIVVYLLFYYLTDFSETVNTYLENSTDIEAKKAFLKQRNVVRFVSGFVYMLYAIFLEASPLQGTLGKRLMKIMVVDEFGNRISRRKSFNRNLYKMFSILPAFIGCVAAFFHKKKQGWHERYARTYVMQRAEHLKDHA